jgi:hypothetical protein
MERKMPSMSTEKERISGTPREWPLNERQRRYAYKSEVYTQAFCRDYCQTTGQAASQLCTRTSEMHNMGALDQRHQPVNDL